MLLPCQFCSVDILFHRAITGIFEGIDITNKIQQNVVTVLLSMLMIRNTKGSRSCIQIGLQI